MRNRSETTWDGYLAPLFATFKTLNKSPDVENCLTLLEKHKLHKSISDVGFLTNFVTVEIRCVNVTAAIAGR